MNAAAVPMLEYLRPLVVLLAAASLLFICTCLTYRALRRGWRLAIIAAFVLMGIFAVLFTELLSAFKALTFAGIAVSWGIMGLILAWRVVRQSGDAGAASISAGWQRIAGNLSSLPKGSKAAIGILLIVLLPLAVTAFASAPNTWDSMTYHLPRVMHWLQNRSIDFYPTAIERQLFLGPFAEFAILHLEALAGGDRLASFVQYGSMIGSLIGVSLIAKILGAHPPAQVFAALATITIPMGILQSTGTQNDYVVSLWLLCFCALVLLQVRYATSWTYALLTGASLGLAVLTKVTAALFAAPMGLWLAMALFRRSRSAAFTRLGLVLGSAVLILLPHSLRNQGLYGNPLGPSDRATTTNELHSAAVTLSNVLRNVASESALPDDHLNRLMTDGIIEVHRLIRLDVNDPRTTFPEEEFQVVFSRHEARAASPFHTLLIAITAVLAVFRPRRSELAYLACIAGGFILFCFFLRWQPWHNRLLLPLYVLAMPASALAFGRMLNQTSLDLVAAMLTSVAAIAYILSNPSRPLLGAHSVLLEDRWTQYFVDRTELRTPFSMAAEVVAGSDCHQVGLVAQVDDWEYPAWLITGPNNAARRIEHILVTNASARYASEFTPCAILEFNPAHRHSMRYGGNSYSESLSSEPLSVFVLSTPAPPVALKP